MATLNENLLRFIDKRDDGSVLSISYEQLCQRPIDVFGDVFRYIGADESVLNGDNSTGQVSIGPARFHIRDMNHKSHSRLSDCEIAEINAVAGDMLKRFNYFKETAHAA